MSLRPILVAGLLLAAACAGPSAEPVPPPAPSEAWSLTFEYQPGYTAYGIWWTVTVPSEGLCVAQARRWVRLQTGEPFDPTPEMRATLHAAVEAARFDELTDCYGCGADCDRMTLTSSDAAGTHVARVSTGYPLPPDSPERDAQHRLLRVVIEVLRLTASPIPEQTPEFYEEWLARH